MIRCIWVALLVVLMLHPATALVAPVPQADARTEAKKLQGTWRGCFINENGAADTSDVAEVVLVFEENTFTLTYFVLIGRGEVTHLTYKGTFVLDPAKKPKAIDMKLTEAEGKNVDGKDMHGIYEMEKDSLKWCTSEVGKQKRPIRFATRQEDEHLLFQLKKEKP